MSLRKPLSAVAMVAWLVPFAAPAWAQSPLRVTSDVVGAEIVLRGVWGARSSPAPLVVEDLETGRYDLEVYRAGRVVGSARFELNGSLRMVGRGGGRALLSTLLPGLGQWRDHGFDAGLIPFLTVGTGVGFWLDAQSDATKDQELLDSWLRLSPTDRNLTQAEFDAESETLQRQIDVSERARDRFLGLTLYLHAGNILDAAVRRGLYRFDLSGSTSVAARFRPPARGTVALLSTIWPGLGQTRMGYASRGQLWAMITTSTGLVVIDRQRRIDRDRAEVERLESVAQLEASGGAGQASAQTLLDLDDARSDLESSELWRTVLLGGAAAVWVLNLVDALLLTSHAPVAATGQARGPQVGLRMAWLEGAPALALGGSF